MPTFILELSHSVIYSTSFLKLIEFSNIGNFKCFLRLLKPLRNCQMLLRKVDLESLITVDMYPLVSMFPA